MKVLVFFSMNHLLFFVVWRWKMEICDFSETFFDWPNKKTTTTIFMLLLVLFSLLKIYDECQDTNYLKSSIFFILVELFEERKEKISEKKKKNFHFFIRN